MIHLFNSQITSHTLYTVYGIFFFKRFFIIFRERGREGEKHQCVVASHVASTGDLACNPGMCPDWELNRRPFGSQPTLSPLSYTSQGYGIFFDILDTHKKCYRRMYQEEIHRIHANSKPFPF